MPKDSLSAVFLDWRHQCGKPKRALPEKSSSTINRLSKGGNHAMPSRSDSPNSYPDFLTPEPPWSSGKVYDNQFSGDR
jgi:hypothetical protein